MNHKTAKDILGLYRDISVIEKLHIYIRLRRLPFDIIESYVPKKGTVLDFGCGHGFFSLFLEKKSHERKIEAVDISEKKIKSANVSNHSSRVSFNVDNNSSSLNKKNTYDCVVILNVLYLLNTNGQKDIIAKAYVSLKKGGILLITETNADFKLRTAITLLRETIMCKILRLTSGNTLTFHPKAWWEKTLREQFSSVEGKNIGQNNFLQLYIATK